MIILYGLSSNNRSSTLLSLQMFLEADSTDLTFAKTIDIK